MATTHDGSYHALASFCHFLPAKAVCVITRVNNHQKSHHAEISSFPVKPCPAAGRSRRPPGAGKNRCCHHHRCAT
ncbi:MAG TPA: hypothetical protein DC012_07225 [Escherichia sp.]|nr:hypothetical protein [Escherichia sp.]